MTTSMKLPPNELGRCLVFQSNLVEFINLMTNNMNLYVNSNYDLL